MVHTRLQIGIEDKSSRYLQNFDAYYLELLVTPWYFPVKTNIRV
jgi:hypothetical protein